MSGWTTTRFVQRHQTMARLGGRVGPIRSWMSRRIWREAEADPEFKRRLEEGLAALAAGRSTLYEIRDGELVRPPQSRTVLTATNTPQAHS